MPARSLVPHVVLLMRFLRPGGLALTYILNFFVKSHAIHPLCHGDGSGGNVLVLCAKLPDADPPLRGTSALLHCQPTQVFRCALLEFFGTIDTVFDVQGKSSLIKFFSSVTPFVTFSDFTGDIKHSNYVIQNFFTINMTSQCNFFFHSHRHFPCVKVASNTYEWGTRFKRISADAY